MQLETKRRNHLENSGELRIASSRQRLVQTSATEPRVTRNLSHSLRASNIPQCGGDKCRVTLQRGFEIGSHVFVRLQMLSRIPGCSDGQVQRKVGYRDAWLLED